MRGLRGKRVLITGGASGIGAATAQRFVEEGALVSILDHDADAAAQIKNSLPSLKNVFIADVSDPEVVQRAFIEMDKRSEGIDAAQ